MAKGNSFGFNLHDMLLQQDAVSCKNFQGTQKDGGEIMIAQNIDRPRRLSMEEVIQLQ